MIIESSVMFVAGVAAVLIGKTALEAVLSGELYRAGVDLIERETAGKTFWAIVCWRTLLCLMALLVAAYGLMATLGSLDLIKIEL